MKHIILQRIAISLLVALTLISAALGWYFRHSEWLSQPWLIGLVWLSVMLKGQQITDVFMELSQAPKLWRGLLLSYVTVVPSILCLIYWL